MPRLVKVLHCLFGLVVTLALLAGSAWLYFFAAPVHGPGDGRFTVLAATSLLHDGDLDLSEFREAVLLGRPHELRTDVPGQHRFAQPPGTALLVLPAIVAVERSLLTRTARLAPVHTFVEEHNEGAKLPEMPSRIRVEDVRPFLDRALACLLAAAAVMLLAWLAAARAGWIAGALTAAAVACGSSLWPSLSQSLWAEGPTLCALALGMLGLELGRTRPHWTGLAGLPLGFAWLCSPAVLPVLVVLLLHVLIHARGQALRFLGWMLPTIVPFVVDSWLREGGLVPLEYLIRSPTNFDPLETGLGHWIAPSRGLLVFSPFLLTGLAVLGPGGRDRRAWLDLWALVAAIAFSAVVAFDDRAWIGHGFGARAMAPVLALLVLPFAGAVRSALDGILMWRPWLALAIAASVGFAVFVHRDAVTSTKAWEWNVTPRAIEDDPARLWNPDDPQVLAGLLR